MVLPYDLKLIIWRLQEVFLLAFDFLTLMFAVVVVSHVHIVRRCLDLIPRKFPQGAVSGDLSPQVLVLSEALDLMAFLVGRG